MDIQSLNKRKFSDAFYNAAVKYHRTGELPQLTTKAALRRFREKANLFELGVKSDALSTDALFAYVKSKSANLRNKRVELIPPGKLSATLSALYNNPETTHNGRDSFYQKVLNRYCGISRRAVHGWLKQQENYQLHLLQPREKIVRPTNVTKINAIFQIDLIDMQKYKSPQNRHTSFLLTCIDTFSKYTWVAPLTKKTAGKVVEALRDILQQNYLTTGDYPSVIQSDNGKEFTNKRVKELLKSLNIKQLFSLPYLPQAQGIIERYNRTIKSAIHAQLTRRKSNKYIDILPQLVRNYNNSRHRSIAAKPANIHKSNRISARQKTMMQRRINRWIEGTRKYPTIKRGHHVRVHILTDKNQRKNRVFAKKYLPQWSRAIYRVVGIRNTNSRKRKKTYILTQIARDDGTYIPDAEQPRIKKGFYRHDLQRIKCSNKFIKHATNVIQRKPRRRKKPIVPRVRSKRKRKLPGRFRDYEVY